MCILRQYYKTAKHCKRKFWQNLMECVKEEKCCCSPEVWVQALRYHLFGLFIVQLLLPTTTTTTKTALGTKSGGGGWL